MGGRFEIDFNDRGSAKRLDKRSYNSQSIPENHFINQNMNSLTQSRVAKFVEGGEVDDDGMQMASLFDKNMSQRNKKESAVLSDKSLFYHIYDKVIYLEESSPDYHRSKLGQYG